MDTPILTEPSPTSQLAIAEYAITPDTLPDRFIARLALRYLPRGYVEAITAAQRFVEARYADVAVAGVAGSANGDQITLWFYSSGKKAGV